MTMLNTGSIVNLYLQPKRSNQINVFAGFLPANEQTGGKLLLTVDANVQLKNAFGGGENLGIIWQQIQPKSPRLNLQFQQPYIFNSNFGIDLQFELYKRDSAFLNINALFGVQYAISTNQTGKISLKTSRSNVLTADTTSIKTLKQLPDVADVSSVNLVLDYDFNKTNYRFNPKSGNELNVSLQPEIKKYVRIMLSRKLRMLLTIILHLYDSIKLNTYQLRLTFTGCSLF